jgi:hypothetical protein
MYLLKWVGYPSKYNSWEKWQDLSPETQQDLKDNPVRMYGRKPANFSNNSLNETIVDSDVPNSTSQARTRDVMTNSNHENGEIGGSGSGDSSGGSSSSGSSSDNDDVMNSDDEDDDEELRLQQAYEAETDVEESDVE